MELLLEVVGQREVEEWPPGGGQLHGDGQAALHNSDVAGGEVPVEPGHEAADIEAVGQGPSAGERRRVQAGSATTTMRSSGTARRTSG